MREGGGVRLTVGLRCRGVVAGAAHRCAAAAVSDFAFLRDAVSLSDSALSKQLGTLKKDGYVEQRLAGDVVGDSDRTIAPTRSGHVVHRSGAQGPRRSQARAAMI
ncbi:transcriptional regulator [Amycolatopsis sp. lyj-109]|uniref:transcriptional regulator n=1 Tax=Amycolatopsis sp. lyj-109 TaxID=2789287 RepID=UPI00397D3353